MADGDDQNSLKILADELQALRANLNATTITAEVVAEPVAEVSAPKKETDLLLSARGSVEAQKKTNGRLQTRRQAADEVRGFS